MGGEFAQNACHACNLAKIAKTILLKQRLWRMLLQCEPKQARQSLADIRKGIGGRKVRTP